MVPKMFEPLKFDCLIDVNAQFKIKTEQFYVLIHIINRLQGSARKGSYVGSEGPFQPA